MFKFKIGDVVIINNCADLVGQVVDMKFDSLYTPIYRVEVDIYTISFTGLELKKYYKEEFLLAETEDLC